MVTSNRTYFVWLAISSLATWCTSIGTAHREIVAFTDGEDHGWKTWDWDAITVLSFWTAPSDDVRAKALANNVRLFQDSHLPDAKDWTDKDKRKSWVKDKVTQIQQNKLDGIFFDFEGQLSGEKKKAYTDLAQETSAALAPLNASIFICVGARPSYEFRDYDYKGLADASEFLFIMGYDAHFWDDYTCVTKGTCSPAEASVKEIEAGVKEYKAKVSGDKLVLGLPWYGIRYTRVVFPFNEGEIHYDDVLSVIDTPGRVKHKTLDKESQTWKIVCDGQCLKGAKGDEIWFDDATTLKPKYKVADDNDLLGVGVFEISDLPLSDDHAQERQDMWNAIANWHGQNNSSMTITY